MLDREDDAALAEMEAALRREDPAFVLLIERLEHDPLGVPGATRSGESRSGVNDDQAETTPAGWNPGQPGLGDEQPSPPLNRRFDDPIHLRQPPGTRPSPWAGPPTPGPSAGHLTPAKRSLRERVLPWLVTLMAMTTAMAMTVIVAALAGPDLGGLMGVVSITAASFWCYQRMARCPARCRRR